MLICHKLVVSHEAAVLQACHVSDVHATSAVYVVLGSCEAFFCRRATHPVLSITSSFSNTITRQQRLTTIVVWRRSWRTHESFIHAEQIIIILHLFFFCSLYLFLFLIVLYRTRVTVYTEYIFLTNASNSSSFTGGVFYPSPR